MFGQQGGGGGGMGGGGPGMGDMSDNPYANLGKTNVAPKPEAPKVIAKGMKLGGIGGTNKKKDNLMAGMMAEDNLMGGGNAADPFGLGLAAPAAALARPPQNH